MFVTEQCGFCQRLVKHVAESMICRDSCVPVVFIVLGDRNGESQGGLERSRCPVLLDESGEVGRAYSVSGVPSAIATSVGGRATSEVRGMPAAWDAIREPGADVCQ